MRIRQGVAQGGATSPLLLNLWLQEVFKIVGVEELGDASIADCLIWLPFLGIDGKNYTGHWELLQVLSSM